MSKGKDKEQAEQEKQGWRVPPVEPVRVPETGPGSSPGDYTESHPSYGMIRIGRRYGGCPPLFGSPIDANASIVLTISRGVVKRSLSRDWYHARDELIEVVMSPAQFAELITNMNNGSGIPCTLDTVARERMPDCPQTHHRQRIESEFRDGMLKLAADVRKLTADAIAILEDKTKKTLTNADRAVLRAAMDRTVRFLWDSAPFIQGQFNEAMEDTVNAARAEFSAAAATIAHSLGLDQMAARFVGDMGMSSKMLSAATETAAILGGAAPSPEEGDGTPP